MHKCIRYRFKMATGKFEQVVFDERAKVAALKEDLVRNAYTAREEENNRKLFGPAAMNIEIKGYFKLFYEEILTPFYIFQIVSFLGWMYQGYEYYATILLLLTLKAAHDSLTLLRNHLTHVRRIAHHSSKVRVFKGSVKRFVEQDSSMLVPGAII